MNESLASPNRLLLFLSLLLVLSPIAYARTDIGKDGIVVYDISATNAPSSLLAIVQAKETYSPGDLIEITIGSNVPCNTKAVFLVIESAEASLYYKDISSLFFPCSTSYVKVSFSGPANAGNYKINVIFKDSNGATLYTDSTPFSVGTGDCPADYCTGWSTTQKYEYGTLQQKTCYTYDQSLFQLSCKQSQQQEYRTVCDSGFNLVNGACVKPDNVATCGDRVVQTGEACDAGDENGICPATCNKMCQKSNCAELPNEPPSGDDEKDDPITIDWRVIGTVGLLLFGMYLVTRKR